MLSSPHAFGQTTPDPGIAGPLAVTKAEYNLGDAAYALPSPASAITVEVRGSVHYPTGLPGGPYPVLLFLHGRHSTCYNYTTLGGVALTWPCPVTDSPIVSYEGYDYLAQNMASHGYIVISVSCNKINAVDNGLPDLGMQERAELVQHHLDLWNTWNTSGTGPFGSTFIGKLDMQNIGTMGHSRGGEGVIYHALYNKSLGSPYGIKAVLTLAPVDFWRHVMTDIPLMDVAPYCDGDVSNIAGVHFYDDARYKDTTDIAAKHTVLFMGANHNFFNTVWTPGSYPAGGADDWLAYIGGGAVDPQCGPAMPGTGRFDTTKQKAALTTYLAAFFRVYVGRETQFAPILDTRDIVPPASSTLAGSQVFVSYQPGKTDRLDINRTDSLDKSTSNTLNDTVSVSGLAVAGICADAILAPDCGIIAYGDQRPHDDSDGPSPLAPELAQMSMQWTDTTQWYQNDIPAAFQDLSGYEVVQFRSSVNFATSAPGVNLDFTVQLIDSSGAIASQPVSTHSNALFYQPGNTFQEVPKVVMNTVSIPLSAFTGINLSKVRKVRFLYDRLASGAVVVSDLQFANSACGKLSTTYTSTITAAEHASFTSHTVSNQGDSVVYLWNFGDASSGTSNTSTLQNPLHTFVGLAPHNVCLYVADYRKNGFVCTDTVLPDHYCLRHCRCPARWRHASPSSPILPRTTCR